MRLLFAVCISQSFELCHLYFAISIFKLVEWRSLVLIPPFGVCVVRLSVCRRLCSTAFVWPPSISDMPVQLYQESLMLRPYPGVVYVHSVLSSIQFDDFIRYVTDVVSVKLYTTPWALLQYYTYPALLVELFTLYCNTKKVDYNFLNLPIATIYYFCMGVLTRSFTIHSNMTIIAQWTVPNLQCASMTALETIRGLIRWPDPAGLALSARYTLEFHMKTIWYFIQE